MSREGFLMHKVTYFFDIWGKIVGFFYIRCENRWNKKSPPWGDGGLFEWCAPVVGSGIGSKKVLGKA